MSDLYKKISGSFIIKVVGLVLAFVFQILLGNTLSQEVYGEFEIFLTYSNILTVLTLIGMNQNLIKEVPKPSNSPSRSFALLRYSLITSTVLVIISISIIAIIQPALRLTWDVLAFFSATLLVKTLFTIFDGYLQGIGKIVKVTFLSILLNNLLKFVFYLLFITVGKTGLYAAILSFLISEVICLGLRFIDVYRFKSKAALTVEKLDRQTRSNFIRYSITLALISGIGILMQNIDKVMLSLLMDLKSVAVYKVAQNYVALISVFVAPFIAFWPVISRLYAENNIKQIQLEMKRIVKIVTSLVIPMFFLFYFLNDRLLLIFGSEYVTQDARNVLLILSFAFLIDAISGPIGAILMMTKHAKLVLFNSIAALLLNIVLNFIFINHFGIAGVALGTGISLILLNLIAIIEVKSIMSIFTYDLSNVTQILLFSLFNYGICYLLAHVMSAENIYIYCIVFGIIVYLINILVIALIYRKTLRDKLIEFLKKKRDRLK